MESGIPGCFQDGQEFSQIYFYCVLGWRWYMAALLCMMSAFGVVDGFIGYRFYLVQVHLSWHLDQCRI